MYIYRIEKPDGIGPYWRCEEIYDSYGNTMRDCHNNSTTHPGMWAEFNDREIAWNYDWRCGFNSVEQMYTWFEGWFDILADNGYYVAIYAVTEVRIGKYQCIFKEGVHVDILSIHDVLQMI